MKKITLLALIIFTACTNANIEENSETTESGQQIIVREVPLQDNFKGAKVKKDNIKQGCSAQDCIPAINNPIFESMEQGNTWLDDEDTVFAINYNGIERAYAQRIMNWHEIVNDKFQDTYVAVTFCPLCGSALAFEREVNGIITEFGVSGKLHNSDLIMYDRYEGNLWQQITGEAIVGPAARRDETLKQIPIITTNWGRWKKDHPNTEVLSLDTSYSRDYSRYPYGTYESDGELYFGVENLDETLQIKTEIYGLEINGESRAYTLEALQRDKIIIDTLGGENISLTYNDDGSVTLISLAGIDKSSEFNPPTRLFWFAWASFHPDTTIYKGS
ncbi:DUF3179 domain-containing protein [Candidatus Gracilibacteria bacterium]|nr:DUF3179 domain-containing protein [Candidatus Gracilibacteria bacterium]